MKNKSSPRAPRTSPAGRDELNLIDFPISLLQFQQPTDANGKRPDELVCTIESYDRHLDQIVPRTLTRRTASKHGFPTPIEEVVLVALLTLSRMKNNFQSPRIEFRNSELYELMGWPNNGNSNEQLSVALDRLKGLSLKYENAWTTGGDQFKKEFSTGLLDSYEFVTKTGSGKGAGTSWIQWASEIFADIQQGNVKQLDTQRYFSLKYPITRRIYRFLDKRFGECPQFEMDLLTFATHVGISGTKHIGKIKERLSRAIDELVSLEDFIQPEEARYIKQGVGRWTIRFTAAGATVNDATNRKSKSTNAQRRDHNKASNLVLAFCKHWNGKNAHRVTANERRQAQEVIDCYGEQAAFEMLPLVIRKMRKLWPDARVFGATVSYWHDAQQILIRRQASQSFTVKSDPKQDEETRQQREQRQRLRQQWRDLTNDERASILNRVSQTADAKVRQFIAEGKQDTLLVELACMEELQRRLAS